MRVYQGPPLYWMDSALSLCHWMRTLLLSPQSARWAATSWRWGASDLSHTALWICHRIGYANHTIFTRIITYESISKNTWLTICVNLCFSNNISPRKGHRWPNNRFPCIEWGYTRGPLCIGWIRHYLSATGCVRFSSVHKVQDEPLLHGDGVRLISVILPSEFAIE